MLVEIIDRPPVGGSGLPPLPPYLRKRRDEPERRVFIVPDLQHIESRTLVYDRENNWITVIYQWMNRVVGGSLLADDAVWEITHVQTRRYRQWLDTFTMQDGIPPHIGFGGCIAKSEKGDPTFYDRWKAYVRETFV